MKSYLLLQLSLLLSFTGIAQNELNLIKKGDSGFEASIRVSAGQTLYSIAKATGHDVDELMRRNGKSNTHLHIGETINVEVNFNNVSLYRPNHGDFTALYYVVSRGDNLYRIAHRSNLSTVQILQLNDKSNADLSINERIFLGWLPWSETSTTIDKHQSIAIAPISRESIIEPLSFMIRMPDAPELDLRATDQERQIVQEKGIAYWDKEATVNQELVVMHPNAPINSEITLYNPMLKRKVNAIVVGEFSKHSYANDISVVISPSVANALGALDKRFLVEISYSE